MYEPKKSFLFWVVYFPLILSVLHYAVELISRLTTWYSAEPDSMAFSRQDILFGRYYTFETFVQTKLKGLLLVAILGFGVWMYGYFSAKKGTKNETDKL